MKKRLSAVIIVFLVLINIDIPYLSTYALSNYSTTIDGKVYNVYPDDEYAVFSSSEIGFLSFFTSQSIQEKVDGYPVIAIGGKAYLMDTTLKKYTVPKHIREIWGNSIFGAFYECTNLKTVSAHSKVSYIGEHAFCSCESLESIYIYNPYCYIYDSSTTICNKYDSAKEEGEFTGIIYGYEDSTAHDYAIFYGYNFVDIETNKVLVTSAKSSSVTTTTTRPTTTTKRSTTTTAIIVTTPITKANTTTTTTTAAVTTRYLATTKTPTTTRSITTSIDIGPGPADGDLSFFNNFDDATLKASPVKPIMSLSRIELTVDEARNNPIQNVQLSIDGADGKYSVVGIHVTWDERLYLDSLSSITAGDAIQKFNDLTSYGQIILAPQNENMIFLAASGVENYGSDGVMLNIPLSIPSDCKPGDIYPVRIIFYSEPGVTRDDFTGVYENKMNDLMEAYLFTQGIVQGYIRIKDDETAPVDPVLYGDVNNDGMISVADAVSLQNYLIGRNKTLPNWKNADICKNNRIDAFDMILMRKLVIEKCVW